MDVLNTITVGAGKFLGFGFLVFPFLSGIMFGTAQENYDKWYKKLYFQWYPLAALCAIGIAALIAAFYVLGKQQ